jgi:hypothetical protein
MRCLWLFIVSFAGAWAIHFLVWRVRLPKAQLKALLLIFMIVWAFVVVASFAGGWPIKAVVEFFYFSLIYWSAAFCYVITYSAMEGDSPTLSLTRHLHRRGEEGVSHEEIEDFFRQRPFVGARVKALVTDNVFIEEEGGYRLSPGSYLFFRVILGYRRVVFGPMKSGG